MPQATAYAALSGSRLVRELSELLAPGVQPRRKNFARRLGSLVDLSDSIKLAAVHADLANMPFRPDLVTAQGIRKNFLNERSAILKAVLNSCVPGASSTRIRFPVVDETTPVDEATAAAPFISFYGAQQGEIEFRIRRLHEQVRKDISGLSLELAKLARLDAALGNAMGSHKRRFFAAVPGLLAKQFKQLLANYRNSLADDMYDYRLWNQELEQFRTEIQSLLLAETEARLLPVMGLIEAIDEHTNQKDL